MRRGAEPVVADADLVDLAVAPVDGGHEVRYRGVEDVLADSRVLCDRLVAVAAGGSGGDHLDLGDPDRIEQRLLQVRPVVAGAAVLVDERGQHQIPEVGVGVLSHPACAGAAGCTCTCRCRAVSGG